MQSFLARYSLVLAFGVSVLLLLSMFCSKLLLSMTMFGLLLLGFLSLRFDYGRQVPPFWHKPAVLAPSVLFAYLVLSGVYSGDTARWWSQVVLWLPLVGLPLALSWLPPFSSRQYYGLYVVLLVLCSLTASSTLYTYYIAPAYYQILLKQGQAIEPHLFFFKPIDHIRFSLLCALGSLAGFYLWWIRFEGRLRWLWLLCAILLLVSLHALAVRSGLLALYLSIFVFIVQQIWLRRQYLIGLGLVAVLVSLPFFALRYSPLFEAKWQYMRWENQQFWKESKVGNNSDAGRLASIYVGYKIGNENPIFGVGVGDISQKTGYYYARFFPDAARQLLPHNQWLMQYAGGGIIGVCLLAAALFVPLFYRRRYTDALFLFFNTVVFASYLSESTLSTSLGVALVGFFSAISLNYFQKPDFFENKP